MEEVRGSSPLGPTIKFMQKSIPSLSYGFSQVSDGNMSFVYGDDSMVAKARSDYLRKQGLSPEETVFIKLEHGNKILAVTPKDQGNLLYPGLQDRFVGDGLITNTPGLTLFLVVADCIGAIMFDPVKLALGLVHAGRRGIELNILAEAVNAMKTNYGTNPADVVMISSPSISAESYVFDNTDGIDLSFWGQHITKGEDGKYHMDIKSKFLSQATTAGLKNSNISISPTDTFTDKNYYSHRRSMASGEPEGRFAVMAQIKP